MDEGLGKSLTIPDSVLNKIDAADEKIKKLSNTVQTETSIMSASFAKLALGIDPFINKVGGLSQLGDKFKSASDSALGLSQQLSSISKSTEVGSISQKMNSFKESMDEALVSANKLKEALRTIGQSTNTTSNAPSYSRPTSSSGRGQQTEENRLKRESIALEKEYSRALSSTEGTIAQRTNKLVRLQEVQRKMTESGRDYSTQLARINSETSRLNRANDEAIKKQEAMRKSQRNLMDTAGQLQRKLALVFSVSQIIGYANKLISVRGEFELQNRSLEAILQNKEQADRLFEQITDLAVRSPFRLKELVSYTKQLAAFRVESSKLYDTTKMLADISAGLGVDMQRLILAYGQVKAANYLRGQELRQFSEAGINILGELSKYLSETEGRAISTGEVFEMVSKRMVSFGDVEQIFKRLTSAGGIFYNMQEIQAETLQGQISNLKDSMDIMFNEIGKENDGTLKDTVKILKSLIDNWRIVSDILQGVAAGFAIYAIAAIRAANANAAFSASNIAATATSGGLTASVAKLITITKAFFKVLKDNPWVWLGAIAVGGISYFIDLNEEMEISKKKYDILTTSTTNQINSLNKLTSEINNNNKAIADANDELSKSEKNTAEHAKASDRLNAKTKEQNILLQKLKTDFPEVYAGIVKQKNGTIDLTKAQKKYNEQLEKTNTLNLLMKQQVGLFNSDLSEQAKESEEANKKRDKETANIINQYNAAITQVKFLLRTDDDFRKNHKSNIDKIINSSDSYIKRLKDIVKETQGVFSSKLGNQMHYDIMSSILDFSEATDEASSSAEGLNDKYEQLRDTNLKNFNMSADQLRKATKEQQRSFAETIASFINSAKGSQSKYVQAFLAQRFKQDLGISISFSPKQIEEDMGNVKKTINASVNRINKELKTNAIKPIQIDEQTDDYFKNVLSNIKSLREEAKIAQQATQPLYEGITNKEKAKELNNQANALAKLAKSYGYFEKGTESAYEKKLKAQFDLLKKINSEYQTLLKNNSAEQAADKIYSSFADAYKEAGLGDIKKLTLGLDGISSKMEQILPPLGSKLRKTFQKEISGIKTDIEIGISKKSEDNIKNQIANIFSSYDLSEELKKMGLSDSDISAMGLNAFDIESLQRKINVFKEELKNYGKDGEQIAKDAQDKIDDYQSKSLLESQKTYLKYLKKSMTDRVQIELDGMKQIEDINKLYQAKKITASQAETMKTGVKGDIQKQLDTASWNEFKNSDLYIKMFEDLDYVSSKTLEMMIAKLQALRTSLKDLPPEDLKEIISQMSKAESELQSRNVFTSLKSSIKGYIDYLKNGKKTQKAFFDSQEKESNIKSQIDNRQILISQLEKEYAAEVKKNGETSEGALLLKDQLDASKALLNTYINQLVAQGKISQELANQLTNQQNSKKGLAGSLQQYSQYMNQAKEMVSTITSTAEYLFGTMDQGTKDILDTINEIADGTGQASEGMSKILKGDVVGGSMDVVTGYFKTVNAIFAVGDKKKERQIQREIKNVEKLEKQYEKLEKAIDNAYSIDTLTQSSKMAKENLEDQITSYENMIAKEEAKKKTDKDRIKEWQQNISDLQDQLKQLAEDTTIALGGIGDSNYKSAAESFADAWLSAFQETGNGIDGLNDTWDDFINNMLKKQISLRVFSKYLEPILEEFDKMFSDASASGEEVTKQELDNIKESFTEASKQANDYASQLMESLGIAGGTASTELSALTQSLQSASEDTMEATNAYLNSIRFFVSSSNTYLAKIADVLSSNDISKNVILAEMRQQSEMIKSIKNMFRDVMFTGHNKGGAGVKVFI